jgi:hypothetical protein
VALANPKTCLNCGNVLPQGAERCERCGGPAQTLLAKVGQVAIGALGVLVVCLGLYTLVVWQRHSGAGTTKLKAPSGHIAAEIEPVSGRPSLEVEGGPTVFYKDKGDTVELSLRVEGSPILYVDVDKDGKAGANDISYAAFSNGTLCVQRLGFGDAAQCGNFKTDAKAEVRGKDVVWTIPKRELTAQGDTADIALEVFNDREQRGIFYPEPPFARVYELKFQVRAAELPHVDAPPPGPPHQLETIPPTTDVKKAGVKKSDFSSEAKPRPSPDPVISFQADPQAIETGGSAQLRWSVSGSSRVTISPDLGTVSARGDNAIHSDGGRPKRPGDQSAR